MAHPNSAHTITTMASVPNDSFTEGFDEPSSTAVASRPVSMFWRYYWLIAGGSWLLAIGLLFAQAKPEVAGLLFLLAFGLLILGLIPSLVGTVERQVGYALTQRMPDYQHRWSSAANWWWALHWLSLLLILALIITASQLQAQGPRDALIILATLLCIGYAVMVCVVLAWRWRRRRLAAIAGLEELQSFELLIDNEEAVQELANLMPIFAGKQKNRCPVMMRGALGDWQVLLFDWLDINKQPPRREWITVALVRLPKPLSTVSLQPIERVSAAQLHWWHIFIEFPLGLIIFLINAISVAASRKNKQTLVIPHSPGLTKGYQLDAYHHGEAQKLLNQSVCQDIISYVHKKKRFIMLNQDWLLLASHKKEVNPGKLAELVADSLRLADALEQSI